MNKECKCGKKLDSRNKSGFCLKCYNIVRGEQFKENYIKEWIKEGNLPSLRQPQKAVREFLMNRQNGLCDICHEPPEWKGKPLVFICDHIDGNHKNSHESNFRMICPNCDSQLPTFKSKNKGNGREYDREYRSKNKK